MKYLLVSCCVCDKNIERKPTWVRENRKLKYKSYCSLQCLSFGRTKRIECVCANPKCSRIFQRNLAEYRREKKHYCSRSCSTTVNNARRVRVKKACFLKPKKLPRYTKQNIIVSIQTFYSQYGRIPLKREVYNLYTPGRKLFGTWNNAIKSAGFQPNEVKFSRKYTAMDGHVCDSYAEKIIDDWLFSRNVPHHVHVPYHYKNMSADFSVGTTLIEFFGLSGQLDAYDEHVEEKRKLWNQRNLEVVELYPHHLFPENKLPLILNSLIQKFR